MLKSQYSNKSDLNHDAKIEMYDKMNNNILEYNLNPYLRGSRKNYLDAIGELGIQQNGNLGDYNVFIDKESSMISGLDGNICTKTRSKASKLLNQRSIITTPDLSSGDIPVGGHEPKTRGGVLTRDCRRNLDLTGITINRFEPLTRNVDEMIQYYRNNANPTGWVRGGADSRVITRNINYLRSCKVGSK